MGGPGFCILGAFVFFVAHFFSACVFVFFIFVFWKVEVGASALTVGSNMRGE